MFETARVTSHVAVQRRFGLFTASVAVHSAVIAGIVVATVSSVSFPINAPNEMARFSTVLPIELPKPPGVRAAQPPGAQPQQTHAVTLPPNTAPQQIPDSVQPAVASAAATDVNGVGEGPGTGVVGSNDGVPGGIDTTQTAAAEPEPQVYRAVGEVKRAVAIHRVQPDYPRGALLTRLSGTVVLECIIDRQGNVRDARVLRSSFGIFEQPALDALRQWKFAPGMLRGQPVETYFELTIAFQPK